MNDGERDIARLSDTEHELARRLARLGPVMGEQEQNEAEMDQVFASTLRAHLVYGEERAPHPGFARNLRARLMGEGTARPVPKPFRQLVIRWVGTVTAGLVALLVGLLVAVLGPQRTHVPSFSPPYPTRANLIFSFPAPPMGIDRATPTLSLVHPRPGVPYPGHLRLSAARLSRGRPSLRAYRLASPSKVANAGRLLGIRARVRRVVAGSETWAVAVDGGLPSHRLLHSLAVSLVSGELIYHDRGNPVLPQATRALPRSTAVTIARRWLTRLGWPGIRMPLTSVESPQKRQKIREVEFGWLGVGAAATDAATLWVSPNRTVIEAWVWPPVAQGGTVPARSILAAWADVRTGKLPLAVEGVPLTTRANGVGTVRRTTVVSVLTAGKPGTLYLVPIYRFEGTAHIPGASLHAWYSLAPGAQR